MRRSRLEKAVIPRCHGRLVAAVGFLWFAIVSLNAIPAEAIVMFGPEEIIQAGGVDIDVPGYSVPSYFDWNNDGLNDLIVGEGSGSYAAKVRVYLNTGTTSAPQFSTFSYVQSGGSDLVITGADGCLGGFPRVAYWDADGRKDLLAGQGDGFLRLYQNTGTDTNPSFDSGTLLQRGQPGSKVNIDVGSRATPSVVDWNNDGRKDVISGAYDGTMRVYLNEGTDTEPDFRTETYVYSSGSLLDVPSDRSSPAVADLDGDGKKDILTGNTNGQLLFYRNTGTDASPAFSGYSSAQSNGVAIDLTSTMRSRPFLCDWTGDGLLDVLVGYGDGLVRLFQTPIPGDTNNDHKVDSTDAAVLADSWGETVTGGYTMGDLDGDGVVGPLDASILAAHFGYGTSEAHPVPEPSMLALLLGLGLLGFVASARIRGRRGT